MRTSSAITQAKKIQLFANECAAATTEYYETSIRQFTELKSICDDISAKLQTILDRSSGGSAKASTTSDANLANEVMRLSQRMSELEAQLESKQLSGITESTMSSEVSEEVTTMTTIQRKSRRRSSHTDTQGQSEGAISRSFCSEVTRIYGNVLRTLASTSYPSVHITQVSSLLWEWYSARIIGNRRYGCSFRYSVQRLKGLIVSIIIAYAYHMECGDTDIFISHFHDWISSLGQDEVATNRYATPFEVYDIEVNKNPEYASATAEVLFDVLYELGLKELGPSNSVLKHGVGLTPYTAGDYMEKLSPELYDAHQSFMINPEILDLVGIGEMKSWEGFRT